MLLNLIVASPGCEEEWDGYERFFIGEGSHTSTYRMELLDSDVLTFNAIFDSSAIYTTRLEENQWDSNKLLGFADCNDVHHQNSARFGWRWLDGKIDIMAYCYIDGERYFEKIGSTTPFSEDLYQIQLTADSYLFTFNGTQLAVPRKNKCDQGEYYMLFPYFGGDEKAPHDILIQIRRI